MGTDQDKPGPEEGNRWGAFPEPEDVEGHRASASHEPADVEARRKSYDDYVARETILHKTMDHDLAVDPFDENDVEGHGGCRHCG
jgi:hypothetical protein